MTKYYNVNYVLYIQVTVKKTESLSKAICLHMSKHVNRLCMFALPNTYLHTQRHMNPHQKILLLYTQLVICNYNRKHTYNILTILNLFKNLL